MEEEIEVYLNSNNSVDPPTLYGFVHTFYRVVIETLAEENTNVVTQTDIKRHIINAFEYTMVKKGVKVFITLKSPWSI